MPQRAIVLIPAGGGVQRLEEIRRRHDSQASLIPAHVTLVFPFESTLGVEMLHRHVDSAVRGQSAFGAILSGVSTQDDEYICLNLEMGHHAVVALHDRLYSGLLLQHLSATHSYRPHVTLGRVKDTALLAHAVASIVAERLELTTHFEEVVMFNVSDRLIEFTCPLAG